MSARLGHGAHKSVLPVTVQLREALQFLEASAHRMPLTRGIAEPRRAMRDLWRVGYAFRNTALATLPTTYMPAPVLRLIHPLLWQRASDLLEGRSARDFLDLVPAKQQIELVSDNLVVLRRLGIYEEALLVAWTAPECSLHEVPLSRLLKLIRAADRWKLRAAGTPIPGRGPYVLFRGVAGEPEVRRERGIWWTSKSEIAAWFARRCPDLEDPAVYRVTVETKYMLAYWNEHEEHEFIVDLPRTAILQRLPWGPAELTSMAGRYKPVDSGASTGRSVVTWRSPA